MENLDDLNDVDLDSVEAESDSPPPVPADSYVVCITETESRMNSNNTGTLLKLKLQILEGQYQGRIVFESLNVRHTSAEAERISRQRLKKIKECCGIAEKLQHPQQLLNIPMRVKVVIEESDQYGASNKIKSYSPYAEGAVAPQPAAPAMQQQVATPVAAPAWRR